MCWDWEPLSEGRQGEGLAPSHPFHLCRELTEINRRHITESVNSIRRVSEARISSFTLQKLSFSMPTLVPHFSPKGS